MARATKLPIEVVAKLRPVSRREVEDDPEVRAAVRALSADAIRRASHLLTYGTPAIQMSMIRTLVTPLLTRQKDTSTEDKRFGELRASLQAMMEDVGETGQAVVTAVDPNQAGDD